MFKCEDTMEKREGDFGQMKGLFGFLDPNSHTFNHNYTCTDSPTRKLDKMCWKRRHWTLRQFLFHADMPKNYRDIRHKPKIKETCNCCTWKITKDKHFFKKKRKSRNFNSQKLILSKNWSKVIQKCSWMSFRPLYSCAQTVVWQIVVKCHHQIVLISV